MIHQLLRKLLFWMTSFCKDNYYNINRKVMSLVGYQRISFTHKFMSIFQYEDNMKTKGDLGVLYFLPPKRAFVWRSSPTHVLCKIPGVVYPWASPGSIVTYLFLRNSSEVRSPVGPHHLPWACIFNAVWLASSSAGGGYIFKEHVIPFPGYQ